MGYDELEVLVRAALPTGQRYFLLGESFSGPLAIRIAANPPAGLAGVILCGTFAKNPLPWLRLGAAVGRARCRSRACRAGCVPSCLWGSVRAAASARPRRSRHAGVAAAVVRHRIGEILDGR